MASGFKLSDMQSFMRFELTSHYWIVQKAGAAIAFYGGLRGVKLRSLTFESFEHSSRKGYYFHYEHAKQQEVNDGRFLVPYSKQTPSVCMVSVLAQYFRCLHDCKVVPTKDSPLFYNGMMSG